MCAVFESEEGEGLRQDQVLSLCVRLLLSPSRPPCNCALMIRDRFCSPCLKSYFTLLITEGLVESVLCPSLPCVQSRKALPAAPTIEGSETIAGGGDEKGIGREELDEIVGVAMGLRWETLREKNRLESGEYLSIDGEYVLMRSSRS